MIYTEDKAKVVAAVWGAEFIQLLATKTTEMTFAFSSV